MEIPIIVEPTAGGWRARCRHPIPIETTGATRYDAVQELEAQLRAAGVTGFTVLPLEVTPDKPWIATAGAVPDDALTDEWVAAIEEYRRQRDTDATVTAQPSASVPASQPVAVP